MRLIYFSPIAWDSYTQRPHEMIRWFHETFNGEVLWIDPYPTRLPGIKDIKYKKIKDMKCQIDCPQWLQICRPKALPIEPFFFGRSINQSLFWNVIEKSINDFAANTICYLCIGKPSDLAVKIMKSVTFCRTYFDMMDDFPEFYKGISTLKMAKNEKLIVKHVDRITVSSTGLLKRVNSMGRTAMLVLNACSTTILTSKSIHTHKKHNKRVLGYVGTIGEWFDWQCVIAIAESVPDSCVKIIGPLYKKPYKALPKNIKTISSINHIDALKEISTFCVGLIPFKKNQLTSSVDPIKYYEYRSFGIPIISTIFGEMALRGSEDGVFLINENSDLFKIIEQACHLSIRDSDIERFRSKNNWKNRFDDSKIFTSI